MILRFVTEDFMETTELTVVEAMLDNRSHSGEFGSTREVKREQCDVKVDASQQDSYNNSMHGVNFLIFHHIDLQWSAQSTWYE